MMKSLNSAVCVIAILASRTYGRAAPSPKDWYAPFDAPVSAASTTLGPAAPLASNGWDRDGMTTSGDTVQFAMTLLHAQGEGSLMSSSGRIGMQGLTLLTTTTRDDPLPATTRTVETLLATIWTEIGRHEAATSVLSTSSSLKTTTASDGLRVTSRACELIDVCDSIKVRDAPGHISPSTPDAFSGNFGYTFADPDENANPKPASSPMAPTFATTSVSVTVSSTTATASIIPSSSSTGGALLPGFGLSYSPITGTPGHSACKSPSTITSELTSAVTASGADYAFIRLYGTTCDQTALALTVAKSHNLRVLAAVEHPGNATAEVADIAAAVTSAAGGDWSVIHSVAVGNEVVAWPGGGRASGISFSDLQAGVSTARSALKEAGYSGPVVTIDAWAALLAMPELCGVSDYAAANCHAFFDGGVAAPDAGKFVSEQVPKVAQVCGGKDVLIAESGWPWKGDANSAAVPGVEEQAQAVESLRTAFAGSGGGVVLFEATDDGWKEESEGTFNAEPYWGMKAGGT